MREDVLHQALSAIAFPTCLGNGVLIMDPFAENGRVAQFDQRALSPEERVLAGQIADATNALLLKGLFHRVHPERYRISDRYDSSEFRVAAAIGAIPSHRFARMRPRIEALRADTVKTAECLGGFANLDIRSSGLDALIEQVAPQLIQITAPPPAPKNAEGIGVHPQLFFCVPAHVKSDSHDQGEVDALTQALTAIVNAAAGFNGERRVTVAALIFVLDLVLSLFLDDDDPHAFAHVEVRTD